MQEALNAIENTWVDDEDDDKAIEALVALGKRAPEMKELILEAARGLDGDIRDQVNGRLGNPRLTLVSVAGAMLTLPAVRRKPLRSGRRSTCQLRLC